MKKLWLGLATVVALGSGPVMAATFDFSGLPDDGFVATNPLSLPGGTFTSSAGFYSNANAYFDGEGGSICAFGTQCSANFTIDFDVAVTDLSFWSTTGSIGNYYTVRAFDGSGLELDSQTRSDTATWDFSGAAAAIKSLSFTGGAVRSGLVFGRFSFEPSVTTAVSLPGTGALGVLGLAALYLSGRSRRA